MSLRPFFAVFLVAILPATNHCRAQSTTDKNAPAPVWPEKESAARQLYFLNNNQHIWLCDSCSGKLNALLGCINHAERYGLNPSVYQTSQIQQIQSSLSIQREEDLLSQDKAITDVVLSFLKDLYCGAAIGEWISYDGISKKYAKQHEDFLIAGLSRVSDSAGLEYFISSLEPQCPEYRAMKPAVAITRMTRSTSEV